VVAGTGSTFDRTMDLEQLQREFPHVDAELVQCVLAESRGNVDQARTHLRTMFFDDGADDAGAGAAAPKPTDSPSTSGTTTLLLD